MWFFFLRMLLNGMRTIKFHIRFLRAIQVICIRICVYSARPQHYFGIGLLHRPRERWRSIVMSASHACVCVFVCLFVRKHIFWTTCAIFTSFVHVACHRGLVLLRAPRGDEIPKNRGNLGGLYPIPIDNALYSIALGPIRKRLNRSRCRSS